MLKEPLLRSLFILAKKTNVQLQHVLSNMVFCCVCARLNTPSFWVSRAGLPNPWQMQFSSVWMDCAAEEWDMEVCVGSTVGSATGKILRISPNKCISF